MGSFVSRVDAWLSDARSLRARHAVAVLLLLVLTLAAYAPALQAGFVWDDDLNVTANRTLTSATGLRQIWLEPGALYQYYPLTFTSFWVDYRLHGLRPFGYHLVNVILHALNALLLWRVLYRLRVPGAWMAAALFALHPMEVESVAWIAERKNVLSGFFYLAGLLLYVRALPPTGEPGDRFRWWWFLPACVLFLGALLSKAVTCSLPAVLLVLTWWERGVLDRRSVGRLAPLFVLGACMAGLVVWMEQHTAGAMGEEWRLSPVERGLVAGRVWWFYPRSLLWPRHLTFIYPRWSIDAHVWWQYLFPAAAVAALGALYGMRRRIGRGPLAAALCYTAALVPAMGFFNVYAMRYAFVADHFAYLPSMALLALIAALGARSVRHASRSGRLTAGVACALVLVMLASLTARQCGAYYDLYTLWSDTVEKNPGSWLAHTNLAAVLNGRGDVAGAMAHYEQALKSKPDFTEARLSLGNLWEAQGGAVQAAAEFMEVLREPEAARPHIDLGMALAHQGKADEALAQYVEALRLQPDPATRAGCDECWGWLWAFAGAHNNVGLALAAQGNIAAAVPHFEQALRVRPAYLEARSNLGNALQAQGRLEEAVAQYREALRLRPDDPAVRHNLGGILAAQGKTDEARMYLEHPEP